LKSLGRLNFQIKSGLILVRSKTIPEMYSKVSTKDGKVVGKVNDIIGPIMDPHILVKPSKDVAGNPGLIKGKELFEQPAKRKSKRDKKWKKKR
jgi:rRNA processing protein Gar1